jgi:hypothetical protein
MIPLPTKRQSPANQKRLARGSGGGRSIARHGWAWSLPAGVLLLAGTAMAQPAVPPNTPGPTVPERVMPEAAPGLPPGRTDGVVRPPAGIDPGMRVPAPNPAPGTTPVIPPPGSPGGDLTVRPR